MKKTIYIFLWAVGALIFSYCGSPNKKPPSPVLSDSLPHLTWRPHPDSLEPYDFDTSLKGGYTIQFRADDSNEYLFLKKDTFSKEIASFTRGMQYLNLGYEVSDFSNYFVLAHSFGSGNPHPIELIEKSTGQNILDSDAVWIDANAASELLLYSRYNTEDGKIILYDVKRKQNKYLDLPKGFANDARSLENIRILKITDDKVTIGYSRAGVEKKKTYNR
jgi:hypothetical protein